MSYCGGLPAPSSADNPLGYKFSWSSRGVLLALGNSAKLYQDGQLVTIDGKQLMSHAKPYYISPAFAFVAYPNRDSCGFREAYKIPEAGTVIRGTLRYQGFPEFIRTLVDLGFLNETPLPHLAKGTQGLVWVRFVSISYSEQEAEPDDADRARSRPRQLAQKTRANRAYIAYSCLTSRLHLDSCTGL